MDKNWIECNGIRTVPAEMIVDVMYRDNDGIVASVRADHVRWRDVRRYRVVDAGRWLAVNHAVLMPEFSVDTLIDVIGSTGFMNSGVKTESVNWSSIGWWRHSDDTSGPWHNWSVGDPVPINVVRVKLRNGEEFNGDQITFLWGEYDARTIVAYMVDEQSDKVALLETLLETETKRADAAVEQMAHARQQLADVEELLSSHQSSTRREHEGLKKTLTDLVADNASLRTFSRKAAIELRKNGSLLTDIQMAAFAGKLPLSVFDDARAAAAADE